MEPDLKKDAKHFATALSALNEALSKLSGEDKDQVESVVRSIQALTEKLYGGETKKELEVAPVTAPVDAPIVVLLETAQETAKDFTEVISQLQSIAKEMITTAIETKAMLEETKTIQVAVEKMRADITVIADKISIRKGSGPSGTDERGGDLDPIKETKAQPGFAKLHPGNKLQRVIEAAVTHKTVTQ
jgi:uncharacterized protein YdiU (UPF0061 family)